MLAQQCPRQGQVSTSLRAPQPFVACAEAPPRHVQRSALRCRHVAHRGSSRLVLKATAEEQVEEKTEAAASGENSFVPILKPEDLPKGTRKEVKVAGVNVLLFWYRNQIYAIEARSPAEGAYSEGFISATFTQDYGIECPVTKSVFSLKTGEILSWYPTNPVLGFLTPKDTCRPMDIYPVKLTQDAIEVDVSGASSTRFMRGGADTSIDRNNVYGVEPKTYLENSEPADPSVPENIVAGGGAIINPYTLIVTIFAIASSAVAGSAFLIYKEQYIGLGIFWVALFGATVAWILQLRKGEA